MTIDATPYQRGGDFYATNAQRYGTASADAIAAAARTGDTNAVNLSIYNAKRGTTSGALDGSTLSIFTGQIVSDPLGAPLEGLNRTLGNTFFSFLRSPWVLLTLGLVVAWQLGAFKALVKGSR